MILKFKVSISSMFLGNNKHANRYVHLSHIKMTYNYNDEHSSPKFKNKYF